MIRIVQPERVGVVFDRAAVLRLGEKVGFAQSRKAGNAPSREERKASKNAKKPAKPGQSDGDVVEGIL